MKQKNKTHFSSFSALFVFFWVILMVAWVIYSYCAIDLNLTLSSHPLFMNFVHFMIQLGYFNRPLSSAIFGGLTAISIVMYVMAILRPQLLQKKKLLVLVISATVIAGIISYPAFSHDIFNYLFDARIVTTHHQNPYLLRALDFPQDPWTRFMHWTHRYYPYGPIWLVMTIPLTILGMEKFVFTLIIYKLFFAGMYLVSGFTIYRLSKKWFPDHFLSITVMFFLNPLIWMESMISAHNDSVMAGVMIIGLYILSTFRKWWFGIFLLMLSAGIKYISGLSLITLTLVSLMKKEWQRVTADLILLISSVISIGIGFVVLNRESYPWYFVSVALLIPITSLSLTVKRIAMVLISLSLFRYYPYLYGGDYFPWVLQSQQILGAVPWTIVTGILIYYSVKKYRLLSLIRSRI